MADLLAEVAMSRSTGPTWLRQVARAVGIVLAATLVALALLLRQPLDVATTLPLPGWLGRLVDRDDVAYPIHSTLGTVLEALRFPPEAVGLQWLKGAAHTRSAAEAERLGAGLAGTRRRSADPEQLDAALCRRIIGGASFGQRVTMERAQLQCERHAARR